MAYESRKKGGKMMKKVLIVGAGVQGGPCASILARDENVSEIVLSDIDEVLAGKAKDKIGSDKIKAIKLDAGNVDDVAAAADGMDVIINLTLTAFNTSIMKAALKSGVHYVDTSFGEPSLMDIRERDNFLVQVIEKRPFTLDREFKEAGLTALHGCGGSPGTVNVVTRYICDKLDSVDEIRIKLGGRYMQATDEVVKGWEPNWSPFRALWGFAVEPTMFVDGEYRKYSTFAMPEEYPFPDPVGSVLLTYHQHQEPITLPHFIGKGIQYCDFKYPLDTAAGAFVKMGFGKPEAIDVNGTQVVPRDVLLKMVNPPVNAFFAEDEESSKLPINRIYLIALDIKGSKSDETVTYSVSLPFTLYGNTEEKIDVFNKFGTTIIGVALPAVVGAKMCVSGDADRGVICSECLDPVKFMKMVAEMGAPMKLSEVVSRKVVF
jgi:saccharopine dehydrogenase-like NADP-dependent oxidoreductase